ncbi:MAG: glycogen/starch/alpha-glucan phosphorylase [Kiritimatiellia bacterium]|jgi:starch phosphorylase
MNPPVPKPVVNRRERRVQMSTESLMEDFQWHLRYTLAKDQADSTEYDHYIALSKSVRDRLVERWIITQQAYRNQNVKRVYYLSLEFLMGRLLGNNVISLKLDDQCSEAMAEFGLDWNSLRDDELDAGLGNGGLGRLAACFLDSLATLRYPGMGYGLRYNYGIFRQKIVDGAQVEMPDHWLKDGYPWEIARPEFACQVQFEGRVETSDADGRTTSRWVGTNDVIGTPYDIPVVGYGGYVVNNLRLWSAQAVDEFDLSDFNRGSYIEAVESKVLAENLTKVLYPNDSVDQGKELRLRQQYFFVACSLQDILRRFRLTGKPWSALPDMAAIQMNDTHPALSVAELMRLLVDVEHLDWDEAWGITVACLGYTNHTVMPEALECWGVSLLGRLLPRHLQIIYEINGHFLREVAARYPGDLARLRRMSIIEEGDEKKVRMANLAIVGSHAVNGVAALHSEILRRSLFPEFDAFWPGKFCNKTNGITQRRWLLKANTGLASLVTDAIGPDWITDLDRLEGIEAFLDDASFLQRFREVKQANKTALASLIRKEVGIAADPGSLFDVHVKRIHEYKRQLLLALYIVVLFSRLVENPSLDIHPRTFLFAGKAAPGYAMAKLIIQLIHAIGAVVNDHPAIDGRLKVVFLPDYRVSLAERIIPAANVSEQISLAGMEASGTGNMKLMLNGALTVGTLDGANVEIHEAVGDENIFIFGMNAQEVALLRASYNSRAVLEKDPEIARAVELIRSNVFSPRSPGLFDPIVKSLIDWGDHYMLLADLRSYIEVQDRVDALYRMTRQWDRTAVLNVARAGRFSSDRTIREYARDIWHIEPVKFR